MKRLLIIGFIAIGTLNAAATSSDVLVPVKYTNPDVDHATRTNWYALNNDFKQEAELIAIEEKRDKELQAVRGLLTAKKQINHFEALRLQAQQAEIARARAELLCLQQLYLQGQRVGITAPQPVRPR